MDCRFLRYKNNTPTKQYKKKTQDIFKLRSCIATLKHNIEFEVTLGIFSPR